MTNYKQDSKMNHYHEEIMLAGFGGQGIMLAGKLLATAAMQQGFEVTYMPSYGPEVRGGTANCAVVIADSPIASPVPGPVDTAIIMNDASLRKFAPRLRPGGLLIINRSLIETDPGRDDVELLEVPADELAQELGSPKAANMVMLGAYLGRRAKMNVHAVANCLQDVLAQRYHKTIPLNTAALEHGAQVPAHA